MSGRVLYGILLALIGVGSLGAAAEPTLETRSFLDGKLEVQVPRSFAPMEEEMLRIKYPSERRPTTVLTNPRGSVNVALNHTDTLLPMQQLADAHTAMDRMFRNLYPSAHWYRSGVTAINGREFFVLDFRGPAMDTEVRNILVGTSLEGRILMITFNCTAELEDEWAPVGRRIIDSIRVRE